MLKRFGLLALVNIAVMVTISVILRLLGVGHYLTAQGINYESLMIFCLFWGMGGAFISLMLSKIMAKWTMGLQMIDANSSDMSARRIMQTVHRLAQQANLPKMPDVAIFDSPEVNAFATGPSRSNSLVAVSTGLLNHMDLHEVDAVLAHEVSHIANGDMVTMTLIQGVINAFVLFFAKAIAWAAAQAMRSNDEENPSYFVAFAIEIVLQIAFGILGSIVVNWFSRMREFRADSGAAKLVGPSSMISALNRLKAAMSINEQVPNTNEAIASFKISGKKSFSDLFSTHPSLDSRIERLKQNL